jgi:FkbM family methyltransferase
MKSGATESSFYYLSQYYNIPEQVHISRSLEDLIKSSKPVKILWAHDNCDQPQFLHLPELVSQIDMIVCVSNWERDQYIKYNRAPAEKLIVIPNGIADFFVPKNPKSKTAIFFSAPHKGVAPLPNIWRQVIKQHPDAKLKVFSSACLYENADMDIPANQAAMSAIEELKTLPNVLYSSCIDREDLLAHIQDSAFFIHPNVWEETFCVSLAEAMACGCFPITSDIGALPETSFSRGKYVPMTGKNTSQGWEPSPRFINEFAQEVSRAFEFFDNEPETFYAATQDLSRLTKESYDWKKISNEWKKLIATLNSKEVVYNDEWIYNQVYHKNEYNIGKFSPEDIVIDIGSHRGYFTKLCLDNDCKNIHCFEPEPNNFKCLTENLKDYKYAQLYNYAVLDKKGDKEFNIVSGVNTGLHSFYQDKISDSKIKVKTIGLDDILSNFDRVSLIKIDAEGSEFEILMNSKLLSKVNKIVGEYHDDLIDNKSQDLFEYLKNQNFELTVRKDENIFLAERNLKKPKYYCMVNMKCSEDYTYAALSSFFRNSIFNSEDKFFLIDNDKTFSLPKDYERVTLVQHESPKSFSENMNFVMKLAMMDGVDFVGLSNDVIYTQNWNEYLGESNCISVPLCNQYICSEYGNLKLDQMMDWKDYNNQEKELNEIAKNITSHEHNINHSLISFYCFYIPLEIMKQVGLMDEGFGKAGAEDVDYRIRAQELGIETKLNSKSYLLHFGAKSTWRGPETEEEIIERGKKYYDYFAKKWGKEKADNLLSVTLFEA